MKTSPTRCPSKPQSRRQEKFTKIVRQFFGSNRKDKNSLENINTSFQTIKITYLKEFNTLNYMCV